MMRLTGHHWCCLLECLVTMATLCCSTHILSQKQETVDCDTIRTEYSLNVLETPSRTSPGLKVEASRRRVFINTVEEITTWKRVPSPALQGWLGIAATSLGIGAIVLDSVDQRDELGIHHRKAVPSALRITAGVTATAALVTLGVMWLAGRHVNTRAERKQNQGSTSYPCAVTIKDAERVLGTVDPSQSFSQHGFDLTPWIDRLPSDEDAILTVAIRDTPQISRKVIVPREVLSELRARRDSAMWSAEMVPVYATVRTQDAAISLGMTLEAVEAAIGGKSAWDNKYHSYGIGGLQLASVDYELAKDTWLMLKYTYSHYAGAYLLDGVTYGTYGNWGWGFSIGTSAPAEYGSIPPTYTGLLKRERGRWYCEYYWKGERTWRE